MKMPPLPAICLKAITTCFYYNFKISTAKIFFKHFPGQQAGVIAGSQRQAAYQSVRQAL
jgi:hypothetical protein